MQQIRRFFSSKEVLRLTGATYRQLDTWIRDDVVRVTGVAAAGKGSRRLFTFADVLEIRVVASFTRNSVKLAMLRETIQHLRTHMGNLPDNHVWSQSRMITDGRRIFKFISAENLLESLDGCKQLAFAFEIGDELGALAEAAQKLNIAQRYVRKSATEKLAA